MFEPSEKDDEKRSGSLPCYTTMLNKQLQRSLVANPRAISWIESASGGNPPKAGREFESPRAHHSSPVNMRFLRSRESDSCIWCTLSAFCPCPEKTAVVGA